MKLVVLGTAGYHPCDRRQTSCYILPEVGILLDAGTGIYRARDLIQTETLDIFISHAHLDHVMGLTFLFDVVLGKNVKRVSVHGAAEKLTAIQQHLFAFDMFPALPPIEWKPLPAKLTVGGARVTHFPLKHPGGSTGYRFDWSDRSLAYVTDTTAGPDVSYLPKIAGVDLLLHECNFPDHMTDFAEKTGHSCTTAVANLAKAARVKRMLLSHFDPMAEGDDPVGLPTARAIFPQTYLAEDRLEVEF